MTFTKEQLIEDLKASSQNATGMFEIHEGTICSLMSLLTTPQPLTTSERAELENYRNDVPEDYFASLVTAARIRADKAMLKFPQPNYVLNKVAEESGEVIKAVIHFTEGREQWENVEAELIDNLAMLIRLVKEGDQVIGFTPPEACRAALLQGAEPVTTADKLPANTPCKDAPEHIWLQTAGVWPENGEFSELTWCSDNQHPDDTLYVRADVVAGNSPVIPDGWVMVPADMAPEQMRAVQINSELGAYAAANLSGAYSLFREFWDVAVAAAPQQEVK